jgi:hypothetical protein
MLKKIALIALCSISAFAIQNAELNLNKKDLAVAAKFNVGSSSDSQAALAGFKLLNADKSNSDDLNTKLNSFVELSLLMRDELNGNGLFIGLGVKLNGTKRLEDNFATVPIGIEIDYKIPAFMPMHIGASAYYAPSSLSLAEAKDFLEYKIYYDIRVIRNGAISIGYRSIDTNYKNYDFSYNKSAYVGIKFTF